MSMLAGPRRKQKVINLRAKNNAWSNDTSKFGQRMLEKMGWTSGKGLGAKEDGIVEHVVARYKNDEKGLGFEDKNDQWTKHEDDFNALLANLSNANSDDEKMHSGVSLEDKSKKSKARIHYHKYTRGKDLSRYSEKDIANIFGKKSLKEVEKEIDKVTKEETESKTAEQIFTEKGSMIDYFKNKLAVVQRQQPSKIEVLNTENSYQGFGYHSDAENDYHGFGFGVETNDLTDNENTHTGFGFQLTAVSVTRDAQKLDNVSEVNLENSKKNKKQKKVEQEDTVDGNISQNYISISVIESNETQKLHVMKRNKKKITHNADVSEKVQMEIQNVETNHELGTEDGQMRKKKKKSKKNNIDCKENGELKTDTCDHSNGPVLINNLNNSGIQSTKEKKLKRKIHSEQLELYETEDIAPKKKKKKNR